MRAYKGLTPHSVKDFGARHNFQTTDESFRELFRVVGKLQKGQTPSGGSTPIPGGGGVDPAILLGYFLLAGRSGGQLGYGGTGSTDLLTLRATASGACPEIVIGNDEVITRQSGSANNNLRLSLVSPLNALMSYNNTAISINATSALFALPYLQVNNAGGSTVTTLPLLRLIHNAAVQDGLLIQATGYAAAEVFDVRTDGTVRQVGQSVATNPLLFLDQSGGATGRSILTIQPPSGFTANLLNLLDSSGSASKVRVASDFTLYVPVLGLYGSSSGLNLKHQAAASTAAYTLTWPVAQGASNTFLKNDGSGNLAWVAAGSSGMGTVTSVGLGLPGEFTVTGTPVTGTGVLTGAWATQTTNKVFASPAGSTGTPAFRALVASDLGTGTANSSSYLRGDLTWATISTTLPNHTHDSSIANDGGGTINADLVTAKTFLSAGVAGPSAGSTGVLRIWDGNSTRRHSITIDPLVALTGDRAFFLPDINGNIFVVGNGADPATAAGTMSPVNRVTITASISSQVIAKTCPIGMYMLNVYLLCTTSGGGNARFDLTWTDATGGVGSPITKTGVAAIGVATIGTANQATIPFYKSSTADVTWTLTVTGRTTDVYALRARLSYMGA